MQKVGRFEFVIDAYLTDFRGRATLPMIGGFMLQVATKHAEQRGFGYGYMTERNRAWVLSRMVIEMFEYPQNDTKLYVNTWIAKVNRLFTERLFSFEDETGKEIGFARTLWASIDLETRKPTNILELESMTAFVDSERPCPIGDMAKIKASGNESKIIDSFTIKYSDVDINSHLNSMKYIEHLVDVFDIKMFKEKEIKRIEINYLTEGLYGANIDIAESMENESTYILDMKHEDISISTSRVFWK